jgi:hypothetical protein
LQKAAQLPGNDELDELVEAEELYLVDVEESSWSLPPE